MTSLPELRALLVALLRALIGRWEWQPPSWLGWLAGRVQLAWRYLMADLKRAAAVLLVLVAMAGGWVWYKHRPVPHYVTYTVTAPGLTEYDESPTA